MKIILSDVVHNRGRGLFEVAKIWWFTILKYARIMYYKIRMELLSMMLKYDVFDASDWRNNK
jgi:hypothetical protein